MRARLLNRSFASPKLMFILFLKKKNKCTNRLTQVVQVQGSVPLDTLPFPALVTLPCPRDARGLETLETRILRSTLFSRKVQDSWLDTLYETQND